MTRQIAIIWHSRTGTAEALARAAQDGAISAQEDVSAHLVRAEDADAATLSAADAYIFVCPENLASMSGAMKEMVDRLYYPLLARIEGRPYALIIAAGTDGEGAARQWARIATGWRLKAIADPLIVRTGADTPDAILAPKSLSPEQRAAASQLGQTLAAGLALGIF
jgi:multimeric flavodoxin WrbA